MDYLISLLSIFLAWPAVVLVITVYLLISQRPAISRLLDRIKHVNFPGGGLETNPYNPDLSPGGNKQIALADTSNRELSKEKELSERVFALDVYFIQLLTQSIEANAKIVYNLLGVLWQKFGLSFTSKTPETLIGRIEGLTSRLDQDVIHDLRELSDSFKETNTQRELIDILTRSNLLIDYLRAICNRS